MESTRIWEKVGFYTNLKSTYPEAMISQSDFRAVPSIFILGDDDPFCYSDADPFLKQVQKI